MTNEKNDIKDLLKSRLEKPVLTTAEGIFDLSEDEIWNCYSYIIREAISRNLPDALEIAGQENLKSETICLLSDYIKLKIDLKVSELIAAPGLAKIIEDIKASSEKLGAKL